MAVDLLIKDGLIVDGSGSTPFQGNVAISDGKIVGAGPVGDGAHRTIHADGLAVAPGFFDMHTHYDSQVCWDPLATSSCWHGITSILTGNCGYGIAPAKESDQEYLMQLMSHVEGIPLDVLRDGIDWEWGSFGDYLRRLQRSLGVNVAAQVAHLPLRYYVMGPDACERAATTDEITQMAELLHEAMAAGATGLSSLKSIHNRGPNGTAVPTQKCELAEIQALGEVLGELRRGIITISPHPGASNIDQEFRDFLVDLSLTTGRPVVWNQFQHRWDMPDVWRELLQFMEEAAGRGAQVYAVSKCQSLDLEFNLVLGQHFDPLPTWKEVLHKPHEEKTRLLADSKTRDRLRVEWDQPSGATMRRADVLVQRTSMPEHRQLEGKHLADLAAERRQHPVDYLIDLALAEDLKTQFVYPGVMNGDPEAVSQIITSPYCLPGVSDAGAHLDQDCGVDFTGKLLGHWVRERGVMSLQEAVRRLTSWSASMLGITDRGLIREGLAADLVLFDPATIRALPREFISDLPGGKERIIQRAEGIAAVLVNGQVLIEDNEHTGALPGKLLTPMAMANGG